MPKTNENLNTPTQSKTKQNKTKIPGRKKIFFWLKEDNEIQLKRRDQCLVSNF